MMRGGRGKVGKNGNAQLALADLQRLVDGAVESLDSLFPLPPLPEFLTYDLYPLTFPLFPLTSNL